MTDQNKNPGWARMSFKGNKVWVETDSRGNPSVENGKVLIKYNLDQDYEYRVKPESLAPVEMAVPSSKKEGASKSTSKPGTGTKKGAVERGILKPPTADLPENAIVIYTDGASSGNPGPAGIGVLLIYGENRKEISKSIGTATNNIAELTAIKAALEELKRRDLPVRIYSDSTYAIGLLTKNWKPKKNQDLIAKIKTLMKKFPDLAFIKVKGHAGIKENEVADFLATSAIKKGPQN